jgi:predicted dehydrogenase
MSGDSTARIGIVGLGGMGKNHASGVEDAGHELVGGADVVEEVREEFEATFGVPTYESHETLLETGALDGIVVTTPNAFHADVAVAALERDVNVLVEKPLADTLANAERVAEAEADSEAFGIVGFNSRFSAGADLFTAYREDGIFGDLNHVEGRFVRRRGIPRVGSWFTNRELSGGGSLIDIGVHLIDFCLYLTDFPEVEEVSAVTRSEFGAREDYADPEGFAGHWEDADADTFDVDDSASFFVRTADGPTFSMEVAWACNRDPVREVVVRGTDAGATMRMGGESMTVYSCDTRGTDHYVDREVTGERAVSSHAAEDALFADAAAAGEPPGTNTIEEGMTVQRVIDAVYRSSEAGEAITLE